MAVNKEKLANIIVEEIKKEFEIKHLSKNLMNTIKIVNDGDDIRVEIPAQTYNMLEYKRRGVIVHTSHGSYASKLDEEGSNFTIYRGSSRKGSFRTSPGNHKGFVNAAINRALLRFVAEERLTIGSREETGK